LLSVSAYAHGAAQMLKKTSFLIALAFCACTVPTEITPSTSQPVIANGEPQWITMAAGNTNDYALDSNNQYNNYVFTPNASGSTLTGIDANGVAGGSGIWVKNGSSTVPLILGHNNAGSDSYNRFTCPYAQDFSLAPGRTVFVAFTTMSGMALGWQLYLEPGLFVSSTAVPTHTLGTAWQNTTGRPVLGMYSVRVATSLSLTTGSVGRVELAIGTSSGSQTTICGRTANGVSGSLTVTLSEVPLSEAQLTCIIPPGAWAILRSTNETATPTYTITNQLEQAL
jgi:hypothetical protein